LHFNDVRRVVRALEVFQQTGRPLSELQQQGWFDKKSEENPFPRCLALDWPRDELYARIDSRTQLLFDSGWVEEVERLRSDPRGWSKEASAALGYREITELLGGKATRSGTIELIQMRTRQFAKRQLTWFRNLSSCVLCTQKLTFELWRERMI
jgi:tRNA dimethylallyltransferase